MTDFHANDEREPFLFLIQSALDWEGETGKQLSVEFADLVRNHSALQAFLKIPMRMQLFAQNRLLDATEVADIYRIQGEVKALSALISTLLTLLEEGEETTKGAIQ